MVSLPKARYKNYRYLSDDNPKNAFDIGKYVNRKLRVKPNESYEFFEYMTADEEMPDEMLRIFRQSLNLCSLEISKNIKSYKMNQTLDICVILMEVSSKAHPNAG